MRALRVTGLTLILVVGVFSLPLAARPFDGTGDENWILPLQLGGMAVFGALVGLVFRVPPGRPARRAALGALLGVGAAMVGLMVFFLLVSGLGGA